MEVGTTIKIDTEWLEDYPTVEDEIYKVVIERTFPFVFIKIEEKLNA